MIPRIGEENCSNIQKMARMADTTIPLLFVSNHQFRYSSRRLVAAIDAAELPNLPAPSGRQEDAAVVDYIPMSEVKQEADLDHDSALGLSPVDANYKDAPDMTWLNRRLRDCSAGPSAIGITTGRSTAGLMLMSRALRCLDAKGLRILSASRCGQLSELEASRFLIAWIRSTEPECHSSERR